MIGGYPKEISDSGYIFDIDEQKSHKVHHINLIAINNYINED